ncbi:DEAD/DEAH box helicase [Spartinivicinus marinus]|uniref:DEAD/DEAH box helicase n=1 Tax=Spartinivicinus marinus TaxID=2994442 RepID=UPI00225B3F6B|nr:DEAD/DEAH box helicase [Spartinivicinus marinus]MCX4025204.1 DEAD/DEAH box helicase family protein [Spartinivicinus marinus]
MKLRPYQQEAIQALIDYFHRATGNPLICISTGGGKSVVIAAWCQLVLNQFPNQRILILSHVKEILEQNYSKLKTLAPDVDMGIYSASLKRKDKDASVLFAGIQSVYSKAFDLGPFNLIIVDECHLINADKDTTMYSQFFTDAKKMNPNIKVIGFSATPYRMKSGLLTHGDNALFDEIVYETDIQQLIDDGYLSPLVTKGGRQKIDLSGVRTQNGDYASKDMEKAVNKDDLTDKALAEIIELGADRKSWLIFGVSVNHCLEIEEKLKKLGVSVSVIHGKTPIKFRDETTKYFKQGRLRCLISQGVLTTGFDAPRTDLIALLRSTKSAGLYVQILGRGLRISPETGKANCLVLDYGGNVERHGPIDQIKVRNAGKKKEPGEMPVKECPKCQLFIPCFASECPDCGYIFPPQDPHKATASNKAVLSAMQQAEWYPVEAVFYQLHSKAFSNNSVKVTYQCGTEFFDEWVCFEHTGFPKHRALTWWVQRVGYQPPCPNNCDSALDYLNNNKVKTPSAIQVKPEGKYKKIINYEFLPETIKEMAYGN